MTTSIVWEVKLMTVKPVEGSLTDVVVNADWTCVATNGDYAASTYGTAVFQPPSGTDFTPYNQLTQDQVLGWCWAGPVDKPAVEEMLTGNIAVQMNPPQVTMQPPWAPPVPPYNG